MRQSPTPLTRDRVLHFIHRMKSSRVVVVGDIMLDRYLTGDTERLSPEAPVPVVTVRERHAALGGAANVAANVAAMGAKCLLVGAVGDDADGAAIRQELAVARLEDRHVLTIAGRPTTSKTRIIARSQQIVRIDDEVDTLVEGADLNRLIAAAREALADADALLLED
jgi:rfaE bifunctional protein kinase chain/domain